MKKINEADVKKIIKDLQGNFGGSNEKQMAGVQLLKGLSTSDEDLANKFMDKINDAMTSISKEVLKSVDESVQEQQENIIKITKEVKINEDTILEVGDKIKVLEKTSNFNVGDRVKISEDGLKIHSRETPAHMGYTQFTIDWRNSLLDIKKRNIIGTVERIFPSGRMNVDFEGTIYDVPEYMVEHV